MMRVSSKSIQMQWLATIVQQQSRLAQLQEQISSGKRINSAIDDPIGAAQITNFQQGLSRLESYARNSDAAERRLRLEETSLDQATDILNRVRDIALQAGGVAGTSQQDRSALASEVRSLQDSMLNVANSQDGEGRYLFAGNKANTRPFEKLYDVFVYAGDQGVRSQLIADDRLIQEGDSGSYVFQQIRDGNGLYSVEANPANTGEMSFVNASILDASVWPVQDFTIRFFDSDTYELLDSTGDPITGPTTYQTDSVISFNGAVISFQGIPAGGDQFDVNSSRNKNVFETLQQLIDTLERPATSPTERAIYQSELNASLLNLDQSLEHMNQVRSQVGSRLNIIDRQRSVNEEVSFQIETSLSKVQDLDYAAAISELELRLLGLEAAQRAFAQTQKSSLFEYL